jgi:hypothetical protein
MTSQRTETGTVVGSLRAVDGKAVVHMEDHFDTDAEDLWSALTDPQRLARWVAQVDGDLRLDGEFRAKFTSGWEGPGRVDVCEPPRRLLVTMCPRQDDQTVIEVEIFPDGDQTRLVLSDSCPSTRNSRCPPSPHDAGAGHPPRFDLLWLDGRDLTGQPYICAALEDLRVVGPHWASPPHWTGGGAAALQTSRELRVEGILAQRLWSRCRDGVGGRTRSPLPSLFLSLMAYSDSS